MAFFDKISDLAKSMGDATTGVLEGGKLNARIKTEENRIAACKSRLGALYYERLKSGQTSDPEGAEIMSQIAQAESAIDAIKAELEARRVEQEAKRAESAAAAGRLAGAAPQGGVVVCGCGTPNAPGTKFCARCGMQLMTERPAAEICPNCGGGVAPGARFCGGCGTPM